MALTATIFKVKLDVVDVDRGYYASHALTIARHPSETDERMVVRVLAFALWADERLEFGRGLGMPDEPDLGQRDLTGRFARWIDVGLPDARRVRRASGLSEEVDVLAYGDAADVWWNRSHVELQKVRGLRVIALAPTFTRGLAARIENRMSMHLLAQEGDAWLTLGDERLFVERETWCEPGPARPGARR